jgi:hypothetical protein
MEYFEQIRTDKYLIRAIPIAAIRVSANDKTISPGVTSRIDS